MVLEVEAWHVREKVVAEEETQGGVVFQSGIRFGAERIRGEDIRGREMAPTKRGAQFLQDGGTKGINDEIDEGLGIWVIRGRRHGRRCVLGGFAHQEDARCVGEKREHDQVGIQAVDDDLGRVLGIPRQAGDFLEDLVLALTGLFRAAEREVGVGRVRCPAIANGGTDGGVETRHERRARADGVPVPCSGGAIQFVLQDAKVPALPLLNHLCHGGDTVHTDVDMVGGAHDGNTFFGVLPDFPEHDGFQCILSIHLFGCWWGRIVQEDFIHGLMNYPVEVQEVVGDVFGASCTKDVGIIARDDMEVIGDAHFRYSLGFGGKKKNGGFGGSLFNVSCLGLYPGQVCFFSFYGIERCAR